MSSHKYRPSDAEIEAVSEILKDWGLEHGHHTAAVLALDAAGKVRAPKKMKKRNDDEMLNFLEGVTGAVEADSGARSNIWEWYTEKHGSDAWKDNRAGFLEIVGYLNNRPICISMFTATCKGEKILFWDATSQLVDYEMIGDWFKLNLPGIKMSDATNAHNVLPR